MTAALNSTAKAGSEAGAKAGVWLMGYGTKWATSWMNDDIPLHGFQYDRLPREPALRLLEVAGQDGPGLVCGLKIFRLDKTPHYHALSYTWGDLFRPFSYELSRFVSMATSPFERQHYQGFPHEVIVCGANKETCCDKKPPNDQETSRDQVIRHGQEACCDSVAVCAGF